MATHIVKLIDPIQIVLSPGAFPDGITEGDMLRWDSAGGVWEVVSEPLVLSEINLTPKAASGGAEGTVFYCSTDNQLYVGTE
jgi:hypothetical protein